MESTVKYNHITRRKRSVRVRKKLHGTAVKPRLSVVKSNAHLHVQLIDDDLGVTLAGISTNSKELKGEGFGRKSKESARKIGALIATRAKELNIVNVVFDRGCSKYHGTLAELASAARDGGLEF